MSKALATVTSSARTYVRFAEGKHTATVRHASSVLNALTGGSRDVDDMARRGVGESTRAVSDAGKAGGLPMSPQYVTAWGRLALFCDEYGPEQVTAAIGADLDSLLPLLSQVPAAEFATILESGNADPARVVAAWQKVVNAKRKGNTPPPPPDNGDNTDNGDDNTDTDTPVTLTPEQVIAGITASLMAAVKSGRVADNGPTLDAFNDAVCAYLDMVAPTLKAVG
jgi:hypothetical protein